MNATLHILGIRTVKINLAILTSLLAKLAAAFQLIFNIVSNKDDDDLFNPEPLTFTRLKESLNDYNRAGNDNW